MLLFLFLGQHVKLTLTTCVYYCTS